jgi:hypothetical protein
MKERFLKLPSPRRGSASPFLFGDTQVLRRLFLQFA